MTLREVFEGELERLGIIWCAGPCRYRSSHRRGFATPGTVHLEARIGTRRSLYRGMHEVGHIVLGHVRPGRRRRWVIEAEAEAWAQQRLIALGIELPEASVQQGHAYVARMRRWGDSISSTRR